PRSARELFAARMLVGVGEVFLYPAALSLIADVAPSRRLASAIGAFGSGGPLGTALALIGGGWLVRHGDRVALAGLEGEPWRVAFLCCGIAGALAAVPWGACWNLIAGEWPRAPRPLPGLRGIWLQR